MVPSPPQRECSLELRELTLKSVGLLEKPDGHVDELLVPFYCPGAFALYRGLLAVIAYRLTRVRQHQAG